VHLIVKWEAWNPYYVLGSTLFSIIMGWIRLRINLSSILVKNGKRLIGLCDKSRSGDLLGLRTNIRVKNFQRSGKYESLRIASYMCEIWTMVLFGRLRATSAVIRSKPGDLFTELFEWYILYRFVRMVLLVKRREVKS